LDYCRRNDRTFALRLLLYVAEKASAQSPRLIIGSWLPKLLRDPKHWRDRAITARAVAERLADPESKQRMLGIANEYERLAKLAEIKSPPTTL